MKTIVFKSTDIPKAAQLIARGKLVAFPTETVYGLGANAFDERAVQNIFKAKGRPFADPIIVHCANITMAESVAEMTPHAYALARAFWPGPLTLILQKKSNIPNIVTGGKKTVGIRIPAHPLAVRLIAAAGVPIAAPSANMFSHTSPTTTEHVLEDLGGKIAGVIKAGRSRIGIESTVVDLTSQPPRILRPGGITFQQLKKVLPAIQDYPGVASRKSPGQYKRHYSPRARVLPVRTLQDIVRYTRQNPDAKIGCMCYTEWKPAVMKLGFVSYDWGSRKNEEQLARRIYSGFRYLDAKKVDIIAIPIPKKSGLGQAIADRIRKASAA